MNEFVFTNDVDAQINNISYFEPMQITTEGKPGMEDSLLKVGHPLPFIS